MQQEATGATTTVDIGQANATGGDGSYTFSHDAPAAGFVLGDTLVTWTVTDGTGATANDSQMVTLSDTTAPSISRPADIQVESTGTTTMVDIGAATATDMVDPSPTLSNDMPANGFPLGMTPVTWTATDASNNTATAVQMITVTQPTAGPLTITAPADVSVEATAPATTVTLGTAMVTGGVAPLSIVNDAPAGGFPVGTTNVTWTVTDSTMAMQTSVQQVTVNDTTPPGITAPGDVTADQDASLGLTMVSIGNATATDIADPAPSVSNDAPANGYPVGSTTVTWTAVDASGNSATATQTVTVNAYVAEQCSDLLGDFQATVFPIMDSSSPLTCNGCHTGPAPLTTPNGFEFPNNPPDADDLEVFRTVANIDSGGQSLILVKARGGAAHAGGDRFPNGLSDPNFVALSDFVARAQACVPDSGNTGSTEVILGSGYEQLHKVVTVLGSRTPTQAEANLIAAAGTDQAAIDAALDGIIDDLMTEPAFFERVFEMYNDLLLTNKDADDRGNVQDNFDTDAFTNQDYFEDNFSGGTRNNLREAANYGFARAPIELVAYVIENDLPFTEILTADYMMVNPYSAVILGVDAGDPSFPFSSDQNMNNHSIDDFRPATNIRQSDGTAVPLAGVIATHSFLARYPSTNTNVNRKRSRFVFQYFLGIDIEGIAPRDGLDLNNVIGEVPTYEDPQCTVCHDVMDPIAGLFTLRDNQGEYDSSNRYEYTRTTNGVPRMVPAGYSIDPADALPSSEEDRPLVWLAQQIAGDDRFADTTVRTVFTGLTRIDPSTTATTAAINDLKVGFVQSNYDFRELVKNVVLSDFFRAQNLDITQNPSSYADVGTGRLLTPEELDRRISASFGGNYSWRGPNSGSGLRGRHYLLYGGIDSDEITTRTTSPTSLMDGIQERIANQAACERVANDLYNDGVLFPFVDEAVTPDNGGENAIRDNIVFLHRHLLGEDLEADGAEIDATYQLFLDVRDLGESSIPSQCRGGGSSTDSNGTVLPWMAVVTFLMTDYRYLYD